MEERRSRDRTGAVYDKRKTLANYLKLDKDDDIKTINVKRLTNNQIIDVDKMMQELRTDDVTFSKPPNHSNTKKKYSNNTNNSKGSKILINQNSVVFDSFDECEYINKELSSISLENYLSKFDEDEIDNLSLKDILTFDIKEYDSIRRKLLDFQLIAQKFNDKELLELLSSRLVQLDKNKDKIEGLINNFERINDFIILEESIKFFLKK